jgi:subtilisin family serine protease
VPPLISGTWLTDSPNGNYVNNADNWARTGPFDLRGLRKCKVSFRGYIDILDTNFDFLRVEVATSPNGPWTSILDISVLAFDLPFTGHLPASFDGVPAAYIRFRMDADEEFDGNGVFLDDVALDCSGRYTAGSFETLSGTSMAVPHVSGVAALVLARNPSFTTAQVRSKLLAAVDTKSSLAGKVVTGGRINAAKAVQSK